MCRSRLHEFLRTLPKCELHVHIEGCLTLEIVFDLAKKNSVRLPEDEDQAYASAVTLRARYANSDSLEDFLHYHFINFSCLWTPADFEDLAFAYIAKARSQNVFHAEAFFDPRAHTSRGVEFSTIVTGLERARNRAAVDFSDMTVTFIPCLLRHFFVESAHGLLADAMESGHFPDGLFSGIGISSTEQDRPPSLYRPVFEAARIAGISNPTAHYGEDGPAEYVASALSELHVKRVDHGIRAIDYPVLLRNLTEGDTLLTLCPISNVRLKSVKRLEDVPVREFLAVGVPFSIGSDDPGYFNAYILENYCAIQQAFDLTVDE